MTSPAQIALITGGNRGIGRSTALHLASDGVDLVLTYRSHADEAAAVVAEAEALGRRAVALQLDVGALDTFDAFFVALRGALRATWDRDTLDFAVLNGGYQIGEWFADATEDAYDRLSDMFLKGPIFFTQKLAAVLADGGAIVNISSGLTRSVGPQRILYSAVKGGIEVATRYMAAELGPRGIRVNTIAAGPVMTDFSDGVLRDNAQVQQYVLGMTALRRLGTADDIGGAIASLLRDENRWITGQRIEVSGGLHL